MDDHTPGSPSHAARQIVGARPARANSDEGMAGPDLSPAKDVVAPPTENGVAPRRGADAGEAQVDSPPSASRAGLSVHSKAKRRSRRDAPSSAGGSGSRRSRDSKAAAALASSSSSSLLADADANAAGDAAGAAPANGSAKDGEERRSRSRSGSKNRKHGKRSSSSSKRGERHSRRHRHHSHHHRHSRSRPTSARGERKSRRSRSKRASTRPSTPAAPLTPAASSSSHRLSSDGRRRGRSHDDLSREAAGGPASPSSVAEVSSRADSVHSPSPQPDKPQAEAEAPSTPDEPKRRRRHRSHSGGRRRHRSGSGSRRHHDRRHRHHRSRPSSRSLSRPKRAASTRNLRAEPKSNDARKDSDSKPKSGRRSRSREPHRRKRRSRSLSRKHYSREEDGAISSPHQPTRRTPREGGEADAADSGSSSDSSSSGSSSDSSDSGSDSSDSDSHSYTGSESWSSDSDSSDDDYSSNGRRSAGRTPRPHVRDRRSRSRQADDEYSSMYRNPERRRHRGRKVAAPPSIQTRMAEQRQQQQQELRDQRAAQAEADVRYYATPDASPSHRRSDRSERRGRAASPKSARYHSHKGKRKHHSTGRVRKSMARRGSRDDMHVTASRSRARSAARDRDRAALTRSSSRSMSALPGVIKHGPGSNTSMASGSSHASRGSRASRASRSVPPDSGIPPPPPPRTRQRPRPQSSAAGTSAARAKQRELARAQTTRATLDRQSSGVRRSQTDLQLHHSQSVDAKQERRLVRSHSRPIALANAKQLDMSIASLTSSDDEDASPGKKRRVRINSKPDLNVSSSFDLAEFDDNDDDDIDNSASSLTLAKVNGSSPMVHSRTVPTAMVSRGRRGTAAMRALLETKHGVKPSDTLLADVVYCISDLLRWRPARGNWADPDGKTCAKCQVTFTFTRRKYHCKYCGDLFCSSCSSHTRSFSMLGFVKKPLRVCDLCFRRPPPELEPFHDWEQELTTAQTQVKSLRLELRAQRKRDVKMAKLKAQRSALKTRVQSLMAERADWANLRDELLATEEKRDELMHALEVQLQRNQEMAHVLESEKRQNQQNEAALMADLDAAEAAVEAQQAQIEELTARLYEHEDNNHSQHLHRRHDELAAMHSQLQEDFDAETAQLRIEAEAEKRRANELAMLLDVKSAEAKRLQRQLAAYAGDAANNGQGNSDEDSEDPNSSRKVARAQLRQIHDEHAHELDAAKQEQNKLHGVVAELEEEICELNNSTSTLRDKCEMLRETVREDKGTINALKKELAMAKAQSRVRENRVRSGDSDSDLRVQLANKEDELTEALAEQELLLRREAELASELEAALADLRRSADASEQLKQCVADLEDVTAERDAFKRMHEEANAQAGDYMQSLIQCQLELNSVVNQKRELEAALKTAGGNAESARIRELTIELNAKARELLTKEREKVETEARAQQVEERLREQEEEHARILDELQHVEAAMHLAEGVVEKAQKHMENKSMEMRQNSASHETVQAEYEAALAETDELRVQLLEAELIITKTQKERDEMHRRYAEARDKLQLCVADLEEARREARKHEEAVQSLSQQNADLMNNLVASQAESTSLRGQVEGKDDTLETALEEAEAELQEAQTELREAHENVESLTTELHEAQEERDRAQQHATELEDQIGALLGSSADSAAQLEALETQYAAAESDKEQLQKELHAIQEAHKGDSETMEKRSEELDLVLHAALQTPNEGGEAAARAAQEAHAEHLAVIELKERVERKSSIITTLSHQLQDAETEKTELTAQVEQLQTERDDLRVRVEKAGEEQEQLASTVAALNLRIEEGSTEKTELTAQVEQLQTERDDLRVRVEEATTEQEHQASTIAALTRRVEEANVEQTELTVQLQTERDDLRVRVDEANTEKTELTAQVEQLQTERDDLRGRVKKATSEQERQASAIAALSVQVKEANTEKTELTVQTVELQNERDRLVRRNKELAKKLEQLNEEHANLLSRVEQREEQLEKMAASMTSLTEERQERDAEHEKELADMHERMQHLSHRAELGSRAEELEDELATVSLERMKLSQEVERLMECNATMTNEMTENQSLIETLSQQLESEVQQRSELTIEYEVQLAELKSRMQEAKHARPGANERDLQAQVAALEDETSQLNHQLDMAVTRNMAHDRRASEQMAATNKALADRIQSLKSHVADYTTLLDERSDELEGMHADMLKRLNDMAAEIQALEATVMTLNKQCENLKQQLAKTKGVSKKLKQQLAAALGELEGAQQQLVRRQADFHAQTKQLEASRDRMRERQAVMADTMSGLVNQLEAMEDRCATLSAELEQATAEREQYASQVGMGTDTIADKVLRSQAEERLRPKKFRTRSTQTQMVLIAKKPVVRPSPPKKGTSSKKGSLKKRRSYIKKPRPRRSKSTFVLGAKQRDGDLSDSDASTSSRQGFVAREKQKWEERQRQERKEKRAKARAKKAEQEKQARE